jgi:hypothetical protein
VTSGSRTSYDVLGRVISTQQDSELGPLTTSRNYSTDGTASYSVVTNARNSTTKTWYRAYDQPTEEMPIRISHPEGAFTEIVRDVFGAPQSIERRNESGSTSLTRRYYYDSNKQLCKVIEPETGPTAMSYDASGNLSWSASGLLLSGSFDCNADVTEIATRKVERTYDERNRLKSLSFPDGNGNQTWTYTKDGLPEQITTINDGVPAINLYQYNNRRLLTGESISGTGLLTWAIGYGYDNNGNLATHSYPGISVAYAPNALGQPTQAGTYATAVSYHPNGAMARFTYGNGIVHTMTQNARGLPDRSLDADGPAAVINDGYDYDFNGNVAAISDGVAGNRGNRTMTYDGLDRLVTASSPMFGPATYSYDVLDNLKGVKIAERDHVYIYDATNRLTNVTLAATGGSVIGLQYDEQGNLRNKNGQLYEFDFGNRLRRTVGKETYRYDGLGRRVLATHESQGNIFSMYGQDGVLRYQRDERSGKAHSYVTLNGSLVARVVDAFAPGVPTVSAPGYSTTGAYTVQWSAVPATTQYQLEESANSGAWQASYSGASTSTSISGKPSGSFAYRARACNPTACSGWSAVTSVAVQLPPSAVPTVSVPDTAANGSYTVSWTATAGATSYNLQEQVDAGAWTAIYSGAAQSSAFSAKPAGSYAYRVAACNPAGCSGVSAAATTQVVYPPVSPPVPSAPPQSLTGAFSVTWTAVAGATSYQLDESANGGAWGNIYSGGATSRALSSIAAGHYGYRVRACNVAGCSGLSGTVAVQVIHPPGTGPVLSAPATSTVSSYALSWTAVPAAEHYRLFELPPPWNAWVEIQNNASTSAVVSGKPTGFYYYVVRGCNAAGCGPDSGTPLVAVTLAPQSSPVVSAPATSPTGSYTVSWTTVPEATSYTFAYRRQGAAWTENSVGSQTSRSLTDAPAGVYEHMAKACNAVGCGPYSAVATVTSTAPVPPPPPTGLTRVQVNRLLCRISWNASPGATRYELFSNDSLDYVGPRTSTIHDARCPVGSLRVRACNEAICSGFGS